MTPTQTEDRHAALEALERLFQYAKSYADISQQPMAYKQFIEDNKTIHAALTAPPQQDALDNKGAEYFRDIFSNAAKEGSVITEMVLKGAGVSMLYNMINNIPPTKQDDDVNELRATCYDQLSKAVVENIILKGRLQDAVSVPREVVEALRFLEKLGTCWQRQGVMGSQMFIMGSAVAVPCREALALLEKHLEGK